MKYSVLINKTEFVFDAHCPALPGRHSRGETFEKAMENIKDAIITYLRMIAEETKEAEIYQIEIAI